MTQPPDDLTQPIPSDPTAPQPPVAASDAAVPAVDAVPAADAASPTPTPDWVRAGTAGDVPASDVPFTSPAVPVAGSAVPVAAAAAPVAAKASWRSRLGGGKGLAVGALVVGLGLGAVGGSVATWALVHDAHGVGTTADGRGFDHDGDFGRPDGDRDGDRGGFPPGGGQRPGDDQQQGGGGTLPGGGGGGTGGSSGSGTDANGTSQAT